MNILKWVIKNWLLIIVSVVFVAVLLVNIRSGFLFLTNDNYSPELNPGLVIERSLLSPAFRSYRGLGIASDSEQADIFRSITFLTTNKLFGLEISNQISFLSYILLGLVGTYLLTTTLVSRYFREVDSKYTGILAGVIYITSLWTVWVFNFPVMPYVVLFGLLPLLFWSLLKLIFELSWKNSFVFILVSILISGAFTVSTLFIVTMFGLLLMAWIQLFDFKNIQRNLRNSIISLSIFIMVQLFWLLPFVNYVQSNSNTITSSSVNESITNSTIDLEQSKMTLSNSLRFYTRALDIYDDSRSESKMFKNADDYQSFEILRIISYVPTVLFILGIVLGLYYKNYIILPLSLIYILGVWGIKNSNPPLGGIYDYLQSNLEIFRQVFRWSSSKFSNLALVGLAPIAAIGFSYLLEVIRIKKVKIRNILYIVTITVLIFFGSFLFNGNLIADRTYSKLPSVYNDLKDYIYSNNIQTDRLLVLPPSNLGYFREYNFGFYGSGFLHYILPNPIIEKSLVVGSSESEMALNQLEQAYFSSNFELFDSLLDKYNIKGIVVDRNLIKGRYGYDIDWNLVDKYLNGKTPAYSKDGVELFHVNTSAVTNTGVWNNNSSKFGYNLLNLDGEKTLNTSWIEIKNENIKDYSLVSFEHDWDKFPVNIKYDKLESSIIIRPVFPEVSNYKYQIPIKKSNLVLSDSDVLKIGSTYIGASVLLQGNDYNINESFGDISYLSVSKSYTYEDITKNFFGQKSLDCSGKKNDSNTYSQFYQNNVVLGAKDSTSCITNSIEKTKDITEITFKLSNSGNNISGLCLYNFTKNECSNSNVYHYGNGEVTVIPKTELDQNTSIFLYNNSKSGNGYEEVTFQNITIKRSSFRKTNLITDTTTFKNNLPSGTLRIPILLGSDSYSNEFSNNATIDWSTEKDNKDFSFKDENGSLYSEVSKDYSYQFTPLLNPKNSLYYVVAQNDNKSGFPPVLCVKTTGSPRCLLERTFKTNTISTLSGLILPESINKNLEAVFRTSSYCTLSSNSFKNLSVFEIPDAWNNFLYKDGNLVTDVNLISNGNPSSSLYSAEVTNKGVYVLDNSYSKYWRLYLTDKSFDNYPNILKQILIPLNSEKVDSGFRYNDWQQAWKLNDSKYINKNIYVIYTPNTYSYIGYLVLIVLLSTSIIFTIKTWKKTQKSQ